MARPFQDEYFDLQAKGFKWTYDEFIENKLNEVEKQVMERIPLLKTLFKRHFNTLKKKITALREVAENLDRVHYGTTVGSLTGGVVGAAGGITSIVGLILAPFTLGASLIVTGVGIGVAAAGGLTSGISSVTSMVSESTDRKHIVKILKDYEDVMDPISKCLGELSENVETLQNLRDVRGKEQRNSLSSADHMLGAGTRLARGLGGLPELVRVVNVVNIGRVAAQTARAVRVAEVFTGVLSALFLAVDVYFIARDATEIHNMRQTNAESSAQSRSDTVRFIAQIRDTAKQLEEGLDELGEAIKVFHCTRNPT